MRQHGIRARRPRRYPVCTTDSKHCLPVAANLLEQNFVAHRPDQVWLADITYIPTSEGWLYLAVILDVFTRKVVGWAMREHMPAELTIARSTQQPCAREPGWSAFLQRDGRGVMVAPFARLNNASTLAADRTTGIGPGAAAEHVEGARHSPTASDGSRSASPVYPARFGATDRCRGPISSPGPRLPRAERRMSNASSPLS
jgi:hypothetical protein